MAFTDEREILNGDPGDEQESSGVSNAAESSKTSGNGGDSGDPNSGLAAPSTEENIDAPTEAEKEADVKAAVAGATERRLVALNYLELKKQFPKSMKAVIDFMIKVSQFQEIDEDIATGILFYSPLTALPNFFDDNELFVNVAGSTGQFHYSISGNTAKVGFKTRAAATTAGFIEAFEILEQKL